MTLRLLRFAAILLVAAAASAPAGAATAASETRLDSDAKAALSAVAAAPSPGERIRRDLFYLADDKLKGRDTGSTGYLKAARYVAARFAALGFAPGADGRWFQTLKLRSARRDLDAAQMELIGADGSREPLAHLEDFLADRSFAGPAFAVTAGAVFVGHGVVDAASGHDDYAGADVAGKFVVAFNGAPASFDTERRAHLGLSSKKLASAAARGAVGFISIRTDVSEARSPWSRATANPDAPAMTWIGPDGVVHAENFGIGAEAAMSAAGAAKLFAGSTLSYDALHAREAAGERLDSFELARTVSLRGATRAGRASSPNVVAYVEGADPVLKNEAVVLTAHLDHIGVRPPTEPGGDAICNGALDNAIGVAIILEAARRFSESARPRRSIYFIALTGEEKGLLGSDYFARFPPIGEKRIVANVNLDMPVALYDFVDVIAFGAERSTLGGVVRAAAASMGVALSPDPFPEQGVFTRSDHYRFVEQGVPAVFLVYGFGNGGQAHFQDFLKNRYHRPTDDLTQAIDYDSAARFADLNYRIARAIADADERPLWNEGDYFGDLFATDEARAPAPRAD